MPRFFLELEPGAQRAVIAGADARHIAGSLRMRPGEALTLCDGRGTDYAGVIESAVPDKVEVRILAAAPTAAEPSLRVTLYQGLPKGDKLEWIIQKAVELGAAEIVPVETARSIARLDGGAGKKAEKAGKKRERWQKIAAEAAGQSGRGVIPPVTGPLRFAEAVARLAEEETIVFYEGGGEPLRELAPAGPGRLSVFIGPEGGFAPEEIEQLQNAGARVATLGKRILRCETAPLAALAALMLLSGNLE